jgi:protein-disulfide isomerase
VRTAFSVVRALTLIGLCSVVWRVWIAPTMTSARPGVQKPSTPQSLNGMHVRGARDARVGLIVFSDFECPVCGTFARDVLPAIVDRYVSEGRVLLAFSDFPLESIHPSAMRLSAIAECAGQQKLFWPVHDRLFAAQIRPSAEQEAVAMLDQPALQECLATNASQLVRRRLSRAASLGLTGTPSLFVGRMEGDNVIVTDALVGLKTVKELAAVLDRRLTQ